MSSSAVPASGTRSILHVCSNDAVYDKGDPCMHRGGRNAFQSVSQWSRPLRDLGAAPSQRSRLSRNHVIADRSTRSHCGNTGSLETRTVRRVRAVCETHFEGLLDSDLNRVLPGSCVSPLVGDSMGRAQTLCCKDRTVQQPTWISVHETRKTES